MTFSAKFNEREKTVGVHVTYGPITIDVNEHPGHLRSFWHDLGAVLNEAESKDEE